VKSKTIGMQYESASVRLVMLPNKSATISNLYSRERGKGHAGKLMQMVIDWADVNGLNLQLAVGRYGHPIGPNNDVLTRFYEKFGFTILRPANKEHKAFMTRNFF